MRMRTAATTISGVIVVTGVAIMAVAWAVGSVGWLLADLPDADNNILRELTLAGIGILFVAVGLVGVGVGRAMHPTRLVSSAAMVAAGLFTVGSFLVAVVGAGQVAARSAAVAVAPALEEAELLNLPSGDGWVVLLVALVSGCVAFGVVFVGSRTSAQLGRQERLSASQ